MLLHRKRFLIPGIITFLVVFFILLNYFAPPGKSPFFHHTSPLVSGSNQGIIPNFPQTDYKNNLTLNWVQVEWAKVNESPTMGFPAITQNQNVSMARDITYCNAGGTPLKLDLYSNKPTTPGSKRPVIIYFHGGGFVGGDKRQMDADVTRVLLPLVNDGFVAASVNYRFAPTKYPAEIQDALCAVRFIKYYAYGIGADQNKIGLFGDSVGGTIDSVAGVTNGTESFENSENEHIAGANLSYQEYLKIPTKPNAVVNYYGDTKLSDTALQIFLGQHIFAANQVWHDPTTGKDWPNKVRSDAVWGSDPTLMYETGAINYVTANEPPFLIVQGDKDMLVDPHQAAAFYAKLKSFNNNVTLFMVKNGDHRFVPNPPDATMDPGFTDIVNTTVDFFKSHLE